MKPTQKVHFENQSEVKFFYGEKLSHYHNINILEKA
jgi:hypothetical protein